ncbi:MAG: cytochrome C [Chloroflexi bacterium]|nr:cytochrome C [Chloroflexota bacterium]
MTQNNGMAPARQPSLPEPEVSDYRRFDVARLLEHWAVFVSFYMLVVTGVAQRYYESGWAQTMILALGGFDSTRLIHRIFGVLFAVSYGNHFVHIIYSVFVRRAVLPSMLPNLKDARDAASYLKYSLGMPAPLPRSGRYDFRQKFEYWGMVFGGLVMIATGIVLIYPAAVTLLLPGVVVAASKEFHRNEAMLAFLTIVIWHLYSAHLRPEVFPLDPAIFDGKISPKRMEEEHPLELEKTGKPGG